MNESHMIRKLEKLDGCEVVTRFEESTPVKDGQRQIIGIKVEDTDSIGFEIGKLIQNTNWTMQVDSDGFDVWGTPPNKEVEQVNILLSRLVS